MLVLVVLVLVVLVLVVLVLVLLLLLVVLLVLVLLRVLAVLLVLRRGGVAVAAACFPLCALRMAERASFGFVLRVCACRGDPSASTR